MRAIIDSSLANTVSKCAPAASSQGPAMAAEVTTCKSQGLKSQALGRKSGGTHLIQVTVLSALFLATEMSYAGQD